jgi:hypothetical protein
MTPQPELKIRWSKTEQDLLIAFPRSCDGHWIAGVFNREFTQELQERGYDITTLRFSVKRKSQDNRPTESQQEVKPTPANVRAKKGNNERRKNDDD